MSRITSAPWPSVAALRCGDEVLLEIVDGAIGRRVRRRRRIFPREPAVAITLAPKALASWIAVVPIPDVPPWTSSVSPAMSPPRWKTLCQTVKKVSGSAAASTIERPVGNGQRVALMDGDIFGIAAAGHQRHHRIANLEPRRAAAERHDMAGDFQARKVGGALGRRIAALALQHVGPIDAGRCDRDQDLALERMGHRPLDRFEHIRSAGLVDRDGGHGGGQGSSCGLSWVETPGGAPLLSKRRVGNTARRRCMALFEDDAPAKRAVPHRIGEDLATLSVDELHERVELLRGGDRPAARRRSRRRRHRKTAASSFFKA